VSEDNTLLSGLRIIEMSHVMAAPTCGMFLADMGADVVKIERLPKGDDVRENAPFVDDESAPFAIMNRNKRGVGLNMKTDEGKAILRRLIVGADIFIENYRKGAMDHYGVAYDQIKDDCPKLIYCSISGFGQTGPYADRGGFDLVTQGMSGLMSITGEGPGRPPVKVGAPVTDIMAGVLGTTGILAALNKRHETGMGQQVDTSLFEAGIMMTYWQSAIYMASGQVPGAMGSAHPLMAPYQAFQTEDGWLNLGAANQNTWLKMIDVLGAPKLADDPRFESPSIRMDNLAELVAVLTVHFQKDTTDNWMTKLMQAGVPAGPVLDVAQMTSDPQALARQMIQDIGTSQGSSLRVLGHPIKYSKTPTQIKRPAPRLGQHTAEVMAEVGYSKEEISAFTDNGVIE